MYRPLNAISLLEPRPLVKSADWLQNRVRMPAGTETAGRPFSLAMFPHHDGPLEAYDDPNIRQINAQWGTRLGKTTLFLSLFAHVADTNPHNMMLASPTKPAAGRIVAGRLYPILESAEGVTEQLLPEHLRSKFEIYLRACTIYVAWSGSETTLADVGVFYGLGSEIDKWSDATSDEADPVQLFLNRFKGFLLHKACFESTPTLKNKSRIERMRLASNNHRRYVPCPFCGERQILKKGHKDKPGGIKWDHDSRGQSNADIAFQTAWYECEFCLKRIENHHRVQILRAGKWVPDGCTIDSNGTISGTPVKAGSDKAGFGPLASWYSLTETWGSFARVWVAAQRSPRMLQDVVNSYMAETWERRKSQTKEEAIGQRLDGKYSRGFVPQAVEFITVTVDRQAADGGFCPWAAIGHAPDDRAYLIDYGIAKDLESVWTVAIRQQFQRDGAPEVIVAKLSAVDSGWDTKNTYDFCNAHSEFVLPLKGSVGDLAGKLYEVKRLEGGLRAGQSLMHVNTDAWETELQNRLDELLAHEPGSLTLCREAAFDQEFLLQLCNGELDEVFDKRGNPKMLWVKKAENIPNDYRDCVRYGLCLGAYLREKLRRARVMPRAPQHMVAGRAM